MKERETFRKEERLCSLKAISLLFEKGNIFHTSLLKVVWLQSPSDIPFPAQVLFTVSKRNTRKAVLRNLARRRLREAYRKNKDLLYQHLENTGKQIVIAFILKSGAVPDYDVIEKAMRESISKLNRAVQGGG